VAGVVGLELRNPLGSNPRVLPGEFLPIWPKWHSRDGSRPSCGVANVQLRRQFCLALWGRLYAADESPRFKTPTANRTKWTLASAKYAPFRRIMTGTPIDNAPWDVWSQIKFLDGSRHDEPSPFWAKHGLDCGALAVLKIKARTHSCCRLPTRPPR
jgi:hypothetical protein